MNRNDSHQLSGAYALHAVSEEEAAAVEAAMADSEDLRGEIAELTDTAVALGLSLRPMAPPPMMRARLLDAIATTSQLPREEEPLAETLVVAVPALTTSASGHHVAPRRRRRMRRPSVLFAMALAAVVLFAGGVAVTRTMQTPNEYQQIVAAADARTSSGHVAGGGTATVAWSQKEGDTGVQLTGITAPEGKVLQLWTIRGGQVVSAGLYTPTGDDDFVVLHSTPAAGASLGITVEPAGGSKHPTSIPIVQVPLSA